MYFKIIMNNEKFMQIKMKLHLLHLFVNFKSIIYSSIYLFKTYIKK